MDTHSEHCVGRKRQSESLCEIVPTYAWGHDGELRLFGIWWNQYTTKYSNVLITPVRPQAG